MRLARVAFVALCLLIIGCCGWVALAEEQDAAPYSEETLAPDAQPQDALEPDDGDSPPAPDQTRQPGDACALESLPPDSVPSTQPADASATPKPVTSPREAVLPYMCSDPAPDFTLPGLDGAEVTLSDYLGKVVVVSFWSAWDEASMREVALLNKAAEANKDIVLITVSDVARAFENEPVSERNMEEMRQWMESYARENGYTFPMLMDANGDVTGAALYNASSFPHTCFIDRDGILRISWTGTLSEQSLETLLEMMYALDE